MQPIPSDVDREDVWQWLNHGWFFHDDGAGSISPAMLEDGFEVRRTDGKCFPYDRRECFPHWPECGATNAEGFAFIMHRDQVRQYRRTYNSRCVNLEIPRKWDVMKRHRWVQRATADSEEIVNAVFNPKFYTYTQALDLLSGGWVSVALNPYLIVAGTSEEHVLYYRGKLLAKVSQGAMAPLDPSNPRNRRILKWLDGRVRYEAG